jgi:hypothetical protein
MSSEASSLPLNVALPDVRRAPAALTQPRTATVERVEPAVDRLVVLVPELSGDPAGLAAQIRALAAPRGLAVLLIGQIAEEPETWSVRRGLSTLAALVADLQIRVDTLATPTPSWLDILRRIVLPGDVVVCHREQVVGHTWPWQRRGLVEAIRAELNVPVCALQGHGLNLRQGARRWTTRVLSAVMPLAVIALFGVAQVRIHSITTGWIETLLLCATAIVEILALAYLTLKDM